LFKPRQRDQDVGRLKVPGLGGAPLPLHHVRIEQHLLEKKNKTTTTAAAASSSTIGQLFIKTKPTSQSSYYLLTHIPSKEQSTRYCRLRVRQRQQRRRQRIQSRGRPYLLSCWSVSLYLSPRDERITSVDYPQRKIPTFEVTRTEIQERNKKLQNQSLDAYKKKRIQKSHIIRKLHFTYLLLLIWPFIQKATFTKDDLEQRQNLAIRNSLTSY